MWGTARLGRFSLMINRAAPLSLQLYCLNFILFGESRVGQTEARRGYNRRLIATVAS